MTYVGNLWKHDCFIELMNSELNILMIQNISTFTSYYKMIGFKENVKYNLTVNL